MQRRRDIVAAKPLRVQPISEDAPADDAINRLLHRLEPSPEQLWTEAQALVNLDQGVLVVDDSTLDKLYAQKLSTGQKLANNKGEKVS